MYVNDISLLENGLTADVPLVMAALPIRIRIFRPPEIHGTAPALLCRWSRVFQPDSYGASFYAKVCGAARHIKITHETFCSELQEVVEAFGTFSPFRLDLVAMNRNSS